MLYTTYAPLCSVNSYGAGTEGAQAGGLGTSELAT